MYTFHSNVMILARYLSHLLKDKTAIPTFGICSLYPNRDKIIMPHSTPFNSCNSASTISISFPDPSNFLQCMLYENEGSGKDQFLGDFDWLSGRQYNTISPLFVDF